VNNTINVNKKMSFVHKNVGHLWLSVKVYIKEDFKYREDVKYLTELLDIKVKITNYK